MKIIRPLVITPAMVTTNAVNADADYAAGTTYADGGKATYSGRIWLSLQAANTGHEPGAAGSEAWWSDAGPSNQWAMFDDEVGTVTARADNITTTVSPLNADNIALLNVQAGEVTVTSVYDGGEVYRKTVSLWDSSLIADWAEYFFNPPEFRSEAVFLGLPPVPGQAVTITIAFPGDTAQCGLAVLGKEVDVGLEKYGLNRSGIDYSNVTFDEFGKASITRRAYVRKVTTQTLINNGELDRITRRLDALASVPVVVLSGQPCFDSTIVYGLMSYSVDIAMYSHSYVSFDVKGLV